MTTRRPLILISGSLSELPQGDTVAGVTLGLVSSPSGLYSDPNGDFGYDGTAEALALAALASGTAAQSTANTALVRLPSLMLFKPLLLFRRLRVLRLSELLKRMFT
jgi:hypothetical protein